MSSVISTVHIQARNSKSRDRIVSLLHAITEYSRQHETGVLRYLTCLEVDDEKSIYMVEEYASAEWHASHMASTPVRALLEAFKTEKLVSSAPETHSITPSYAYQRPGHVWPTAATHIVLANFWYHKGYAPYSLAGWKEYMDYCYAEEAPALAYAILGDSENDVVRTVQVFENAEYVRDVHIKSQALKKNQTQNSSYRTGQKEIVKLRVVQGFMGRT